VQRDKRAKPCNNASITTFMQPLSKKQKVVEQVRPVTRNIPVPHEPVNTNVGVFNKNVESEDVDDAIMIAEMDPSNEEKQTAYVKRSILFEKQHVVLSEQTGRRVSSFLYTMKFFLLVKVSREGKKLLDSPDGMKTLQIKTCIV